MTEKLRPSDEPFLFWTLTDRPQIMSDVWALPHLLNGIPSDSGFMQHLRLTLKKTHEYLRRGFAGQDPQFWMWPYATTDPRFKSYTYQEAGVSYTGEYNYACDEVRDLFKSAAGVSLLRTIYSRIASQVIPLHGSSSSRQHVVIDGEVWSSEFALSAEQWQRAMQMQRDQEDSERARFMAMLSGETETKTRKGIPESVRHEVWRRDGGSCVECGSREKLEFDHIIPWCLGGSDTARNLRLLCELCNRAKGATI